MEVRLIKWRYGYPLNVTPYELGREIGMALDTVPNALEELKVVYSNRKLTITPWLVRENTHDLYWTDSGGNFLAGFSKQDIQEVERGIREWLREWRESTVLGKLGKQVWPTTKLEEGNPAYPRELPLDEISKYETRIPLDLIRRDEKVYLERLTREIEKEGITEAITIRVREDGSRIVWDGIHRLIVAQNLGIKSVPVKFIGEAEVAPPLTEALIKEGEEIVTKAEAIAPTNASVIEFRRLVEQAKAATTPEAQRQALIRMEALEDEIRAIAPEAVPEIKVPVVRLTEEEFVEEELALRRKQAERVGVPFDEKREMALLRGEYRIIAPPAVKAFIGPKTVIEYDRSYTLKELREMARALGLSASGSKKEIAARLIARGGN